MSGYCFEEVYSPEFRARVAQHVDVADTLLSPEDYRGTDQAWPKVEFIFSGWGMPLADESFLRRFPDLKVIFYSAGSVKVFVTDALWESGILVTQAAAANAIPVAEFTCAQIIHALKRTWQTERYTRREKKFPPRQPPLGAYRRTVGILSLGTIGSLVVEKLRSYDLSIIAYDPFVPPEVAKEKGVVLVSMEEVFARADVVTCHTPWLPETEGFIRGKHFELMKPGATFLNTARGPLVVEEEMIAVLQRRPDLSAFLDVTHPEPPRPGSPLFEMENVFLTPHMAGSIGQECQRMAEQIFVELERYLAGKPLLHAVDKKRSAILA